MVEKNEKRIELIQELSNLEFNKIIKLHEYVDDHHFYGILKEEIEEARDKFDIIETNLDGSDNFMDMWKLIKKNYGIVNSVQFIKRHTIKCIEELSQVLAICDKYLMQPKNDKEGA